MLLREAEEAEVVRQFLCCRLQLLFQTHMLQRLAPHCYQQLLDLLRVLLGQAQWGLGSDGVQARWVDWEVGARGQSVCKGRRGAR